MGKDRKAPQPAPSNAIPASVEDGFRRILELEPDAPLPDDVTSIYRQYKRSVDICSAGKVTAKEMILLCLLAGHQGSEEGFGLVPLAEGDRVVGLFHGKEVRGVVLSVEGDKVRVDVDEDSLKYRELKLADTRLEQ